MQYLKQPDAIRGAIASYTQSEILWLDTEVADFQTKKPRLSLIQVLNDPADMTGDRVVILDVLDRPELADEFMETIVFDPGIEKVFHNANYDLKFLGKRKAKNVVCTLEMAKKIPYYLIPLPNRKLKTLAEKLGPFPSIDKTEQKSDWGKRPLTQEQLDYAKMDPVYVACVYQKLKQLTQLVELKPEKEDLAALTLKYRQLEHRWKQIDTEIHHIKDRIKAAMKFQNVSQKDGFYLSSQKRTTKKVPLAELAKLIQTENIELDLSIALDKTLEKELGKLIEQLPVEEETKTILQLKVAEIDEEDLPF